MTLQLLSEEAEVIIFSRGDLDQLDDFRQTGFDGTVLQYLRFDAIEGPNYIENSSAGICTDAQLSFDPATNQVANRVGDFCQIHDSIVNQTPFDHDLNPNTPDVIATDEWFLHNSLNQRIGDVNVRFDGSKGFYYHMNPWKQRLPQLLRCARHARVAG